MKERNGDGAGEGGMGNGTRERSSHPIPHTPVPLFPTLGFVLILGLLIGVIGYAVKHIAPQAAPPPWSANTPIFGDMGPSLQSEPAIALNGATSLVAWTDERNTLPDIYAKVAGGAQVPDAAESRVTGSTQSAEWLDTPLDPRADNSASAQVEANGRAFVAYSNRLDIVLARREPNGSWLSRTLMTRGATGMYAHEPSLVAVGDTLIAVWQDYRNQNWDIYSTRCNGTSLVCQPNVKVSNDTTDEWQMHPKLAANGTTLVAVWEDLRDGGATASRVYASFSADGGATWGANTPVDAGGTTASARPNVAFESGGQPWAVWESHADEVTAPADLFAARWNGSAWAAPTRVDAAPAGARALKPTIAVNSAATPFVAWEDYRNGSANPDIYSAVWNGNAWTESVVANQAAPQTAPALAASGGTVRVAWTDARNGQPDVFTASWNGTAWAGAAQLNENATRLSLQTLPSVQATLWGDLYLTWRDTRASVNNFWVSRYGHDTAKWSEPVVVPSEGEGRYGLAWNEPAATAVDSDGHLHVIWSQYGAGGAHIWYSEFDGALWGPVLPVSVDGPDLGRGQLTLAIRNGRMAAAWTVGDSSVGWPVSSTVYAAEFNASSGAWGAPTAVTAAPMRGDPHPSLALDDAGMMYVTYGDFTYGSGLQGNIKLAKKPFGNGAWSLFRQVNSADTTSTKDWCYHEQPQIAVAGTVLHVVWLGCVPWTRGLYYSTSTDGGATWSSTSRKLMDVSDAGFRPALAANPEEVTVVYPNPADDKFYAASLRGNTWYTGTVLSDGATALHYTEDGPAGLTYDPGKTQFVAVFADRRTRGVPRLYSASLDSEYVPPVPPPPPTSSPTAVAPPGGNAGTAVPTNTPVPRPTDDPGLPGRIYLPSLAK